MNFKAKTITAMALAGGMALTGAAQADQYSGLGGWANQADKSVDDVMVYPSFAVKRGLSGRSTFRVTVDRSGEVIESDLTDFSGDRMLKSAARRVLERAEFPALPASYNDESLTFSLRLNYLIASSAAEERALLRETEVRGEAVSRGTPIAGRIAILSQVSD
ncbi:MAG: TonB family protein [Kordiimonadaceae bacterium]|nr:TonB family protein [Kordiimonadaceae bacterium]MBO6570651.1 TonB family protein [Kordiimonadaceae bacterium]MBO6966491.1 TonB family protein [Kordiimonadaceae bacterium]